MQLFQRLNMEWTEIDAIPSCYEYYDNANRFEKADLLKAICEWITVKNHNDRKLLNAHYWSRRGEMTDHDVALEHRKNRAKEREIMDERIRQRKLAWKAK